MGMYSYFESEEIKVVNPEGLKKFVHFWNDKVKEGHWYIAHFLYAPVTEEEVNPCISDNIKDYETFTFEDWDGMKIISYWYDEMVLFLDSIAPYIQGYVRFRFETDEEWAVIKFEGGKCSIDLGTINWDEGVSLRRFDNELPGIKSEILEELNKMKLAGILSWKSN